MNPTTHIPSADIVEIIQRATQSVFETMLALPVEPLQDRREAGEPSPVDGVIALVGIAGTWTGTGRIQCSAECALRIASAMLCAEYRAVNEDVLDSMAEVANMIIGNLKTAVEERLGPLGLGVPTVIFGRNYQARSASLHDWTVVPFRCHGEIFEVRFSLMPTLANSRPIPRHEHSLA